MIKQLKNLRHSLVFKLIVAVGLTLLCSIFIWALFNINYQKNKLMEEVVEGTDRLTTTIKLGTNYAMMLNSRDDINQIINNIAKQREIENIRIYNKEGEIKFSNRPSEVESKTNIKAEACDICHRTDPPLTHLELHGRTRIFVSPKGYRLLGIISPIRNETGCATDACHVHPENKQILGALDVVVSLEKADKEILQIEQGLLGLAVFAFIITSAIIIIVVLRFVNRPVKKLIKGTRSIAKGEYDLNIEVNQDDEMSQLAGAINQMGREIGEKQIALNKQRDEYQTLFEEAPCFITVQDKNYRLLRYNHEFAQMFDTRIGDFCYRAYKGRDEKCSDCPVEKTFRDGKPHYGEETGVSKDGSPAYWIFSTSPIFGEDGEVVAAMEMSLDITHRRMLEKELERSEKKYHGIFNNIPNPVFVLDKNTLEIIDCNDSVKAVYGYDTTEINGRSFLDLFRQDERDRHAANLNTSSVINQVRNLTKNGKQIFVNIRISPSEFSDQEVLLVTTSDITKRLETEQQLIQASKMATLGEMATGVAHELNQPLSVIKTGSSFCMKKITNNEPIRADILFTMLEKIDSNVDRATKIINHMREFARKSDLKLVRVDANEVLEHAFEIFSQQLKVRGIDVDWHKDTDLPMILADAGRLEQVFINLLINARDAIEERWESEKPKSQEKKITLSSKKVDKEVVIEICDTGIGIPKEIRDKIFEPFYTTKEVGKGTGLGLSISYGIVKDCRGSIQVVSNQQGGACFIIRFPIPGTNDPHSDPNRSARD
jgi:histidine kinase